MADFFNTDTFAQDAIGANTTTSLGVQLGSLSANNTLSTSYTVISASTPEDMDGFIVCVMSNNGNGTTTNLINLYVGASGQEQLLVGGIQTGRASSTSGAQKLTYVPLSVAKGSRITARHQNSDYANSPTIYVSLVPLSSGFTSSPLPGTFESWGVNYSTSRGVVVTSSATINTIGPKTELIASSGINSQFITLQIHCRSSARSLLTLYAGPDGSETPIFGPVNVTAPFDSAGVEALTMIQGLMLSLPLSIPAGTRISAAMQSTIASSLADVSVLAFG